MRLLKQALAILGSVVVVAMVVALSAPKAVHAVVAAAVNVMNTSANPVPTYDAGVRFQADVCEASGAISSAASVSKTTAQAFTRRGRGRWKFALGLLAGLALLAASWRAFVTYENRTVQDGLKQARAELESGLPATAAERLRTLAR